MSLLFVSGWLSVSGSEFQTVEVQSGEEVTLQCSNISRSSTHTEWFRVVNRATLSCIASMYGSNGQALFCDGFQNGKFNMTSNNVAVFLQIKPVDLSDAGLYFCGFFLDYHIIISTRVELRIQGEFRLKTFLCNFNVSHHVMWKHSNYKQQIVK